jgi:hypothetical protein
VSPWLRPPNGRTPRGSETRTALRRRFHMRMSRQRQLAVVLLVSGLTTILAIVDASRASTQARFAALPLAVPAPADNPTTPERVALGRLLFWDPVLSGQKDVACATCHHPAFGYSDGLDLSIGANGVGMGTARAFAAGHASRLVKRNSQTVLNVAFNGLTASADSTPAAAPMFWDLRVQSLEAQALEPLKALEEMRGRSIATCVATQPDRPVGARSEHAWTGTARSHCVLAGDGRPVIRPHDPGTRAKWVVRRRATPAVKSKLGSSECAVNRRRADAARRGRRSRVEPPARRGETLAVAGRDLRLVACPSE